MQKLITLTALTFLSVSMTGQQLQEILEKHYDEASKEKMGKIETIITHGTNRYSAAAISSAFTLYQARPVKIRVETEFQGSEVIQTYNGEKGYMYAPSMGISEPKEMNPNEVNNFRSQSEFEDPLWNYAENGSRLELLEPGTDASAFAVRLTTGEGEEFIYFIDRESWLISSVRSMRRIGGRETEITTVLRDYKSARGIPVARKIETRMNGETVTTIEIEKVEFNKKIDPALFEKPLTGSEEPSGS